MRSDSASDKACRLFVRWSCFAPREADASCYMAIAPDGSLWVALYAAGKLVRLEPPSLRIVRNYDLLGGRETRPYAVAIDSSG